jgi:hypothetical protein
MKTVTTWKAETAKLASLVAYTDGAKTRRAFDVVVYQLDQFTPGAQHRSIVVRTGLDRAHDMARLQRMSRRLRAIGYRFNSILSDTRGSLWLHRAT